jgi:hypothetical protein
MIAAEKIPTFTIVFVVACAVLYAICTEFNIPAITYHPVIGEIDLGWKPARSGPAMYWYGWMLSSLIGALVIAFIATVVPASWLQRFLVFACVTAAAYLVIYTIALIIYGKASVEMETLKDRRLSAGAAVILAAFVSYLARPHWTQRVWDGWTWLVPIGASAVLGYYLIPFFTR